MDTEFINVLKIKKGQRLCIINMPVFLRGELIELPEGVVVTQRPTGKFDLVALFTNSLEELNQAWGRLTSTLKPEGSFWLIYPDKSLNLQNEINTKALDQIMDDNFKRNKKVTFLTDWCGIEIERVNKPA
jgi:hypothetical protein